MKFINSKIHQVPNAKKEPLYTLEEIADRLGVEYKALKSCISRNSRVCPSPKAVLIARSRSQMTKKLYMLSEYKAWWEACQETTKGESK
jgi:hypothetical protein